MSEYEIKQRKKLIAAMVLKLESYLAYLPEPHQSELRAETVKSLAPESSQIKKTMAAGA